MHLIKIKAVLLFLCVYLSTLAAFAQNPLTAPDPAPVDEDVVAYKNAHYNHHHPIHLRDHAEKLSLDVLEIDEDKYVELVIKTHVNIGCLPKGKPSLGIRLDNGTLVELQLRKEFCAKQVEHAVFGKFNYVISYKLTEGQVNMLKESKVRNITLYGPGGKIYHDVKESAYGLEEKVRSYFMDNLL